jgi:hypothetical protein
MGPLGGDVVSHFCTGGWLEYMALNRKVWLSSFQDTFHEVVPSQFCINII